MLSDTEQVRVASDEARGAPLDSRGDVLVVVWVLTDAMERMVARDDVGQQNESGEPSFGVEIRVQALADFGIAQGTQNLVDDGRGGDEAER